MQIHMLRKCDGVHGEVPFTRYSQ